MSRTSRFMDAKKGLGGLKLWLQFIQYKSVMLQSVSIPKGYGILTFPQVASLHLEVFTKPTAFTNAFIDPNKTIIWNTTIRIAISLLSLSQTSLSDECEREIARPSPHFYDQGPKYLDISWKFRRRTKSISMSLYQIKKMSVSTAVIDLLKFGWPAILSSSDWWSR